MILPNWTKMKEKVLCHKNATTHHGGKLLFLWLFLWHWKDSKWRESYSWQFEINGLQIFTHKLSHSLFNWCINVKTYIFSFHFSSICKSNKGNIKYIILFYFFIPSPFQSYKKEAFFFLPFFFPTSFTFSSAPLVTVVTKVLVLGGKRESENEEGKKK